MHIDPSIKAKIEQARMSHDPVAQATASSLAANEGVNLSNAMAAQNTILGKILKKIDRITPDASTPRGMAMAGLGIAGVALLTKAFRKALDSSPMLKQMAKLLDFGVMLVLRPIGDFFGFLFRPILILLLRKFIIPFYQEYMPLMRKLGGDIGNFLTKVIDIATSFEGMTAAGAAVAAGIFAYFKKKGGKIQIFSKNAVANLAKMARPSLWSRISNALTMKAPKASYWRRVSNALRIKGSIPKLPKLQLQIPKSLQPLIKIIQETQDALSKTKIPPTSDDVVKTPLKELDRPPRGSKFTVPVSALSKAATILNLWDLASGKMGYDIFNAANAPEMTEFNKQMHGQASEIYPWMSGTKDPLVDRWGDIGGIPSTGQILSGDWGMGTPPPSSTPNHQIIIQADTITTEAIDNVTDKMVNGKRTFSSLG